MIQLSSVRRFSLALSVSLCVLSAAPLLSHAQVGPEPAPPKPESMMTQKLMHLLHKDKPDPNAPNLDESTEPAEETPADEEKSQEPEKPFYPTNGPGPSNQLPPAKKKTAKKPSRPSASQQAQGAPGQPPAEEKPSRPPLLTQPPLTNAKVDDPQIDHANPPVLDHPRLNDPKNPLGFTDLENRLKRYTSLVDAHRYAEAKAGVMMLRQWLVDLTEAHIGLYKTLNQVPSARGQAELEKELALQFAQLRDRAMVESARIHIAEKDYFKAVKELTDVVKSQPRSRVGLRSYELLQEIGFTEKLQLSQ